MTLTNLAASPSINVYAADGSGTLTTPTGSATASSTGNTIVFTYTAATGGISNGAFTVDVPAGLERAVDDRECQRLHDLECRHGVDLESNDHRFRAGPSPAAADARFHLPGRRRAASGSGSQDADRSDVDRHPDLAGAGALDQRRLADEPRLLAEHLDHGHDASDRPHPHPERRRQRLHRGQTAYFRAGVAGSFDLSASSSDGESGVASYSFPALGSGWSASGSDPGRSYSFTGSAVDPSEPNNVTATNGAGLSSSPSSFTVTADGAAPITSIACTSGCSGWHTSAPVTITLTPSDSGSGSAQTTYTTDGSDPTTSPTAQLYGAPFTLSSSATVKFFSTDNVGNAESVGSQLVQVDTSAPGAPGLSLSAGANAFVSGSTVYFRSGAAGSFDVSASSSDSESGVASYSFPALGSGWSASGSDPSRTFSFGTSAVDPSEPNNVTATNKAGLTSSATSFTVTADGTAPSTSIQCNGAACSGWYTTSPVSVTLSATDAGSGLANIKYTTDGSDPTTSGTAVVYSGAFNVSGTRRPSSTRPPTRSATSSRSARRRSRSTRRRRARPA